MNCEPFTAIDHVQLAIPVGGEGQARAFYVVVLGFEEVNKPPELAARGGLWLRSGAVSIHLGVDPNFHPGTKAHPALRCNDYDTLTRRLKAYGLAADAEPNLADGSAHCYVCDPFGNRIELIDVHPA